jgi:WD40 repeat protein
MQLSVQQPLSSSSSSSLSIRPSKAEAAYKQALRSHKPWKLFRVIQGHQGWVNCVDVDPSNEWFVTGSNDRMIKIWDLASGTLKLSLTGHVHNVRAVKCHPR